MSFCAWRTRKTPVFLVGLPSDGRVVHACVAARNTLPDAALAAPPFYSDFVVLL